MLTTKIYCQLNDFYKFFEKHKNKKSYKKHFDLGNLLSERTYTVLV